MWKLRMVRMDNGPAQALHWIQKKSILVATANRNQSKNKHHRCHSSNLNIKYHHGHQNHQEHIWTKVIFNKFILSFICSISFSRMQSIQFFIFDYHHRRCFKCVIFFDQHRFSIFCFLFFASWCIFLSSHYYFDRFQCILDRSYVTLFRKTKKEARTLVVS